MHIPSLNAWRWRAQKHLLDTKDDGSIERSRLVTDITYVFNGLQGLLAVDPSRTGRNPSDQPKLLPLLEGLVSVTPLPSVYGRSRRIKIQDASVDINSVEGFLEAVTSNPVYSMNTAWGTYTSAGRKVNTDDWLVGLEEVLTATREKKIDTTEIPRISRHSPHSAMDISQGISLASAAGLFADLGLQAAQAYSLAVRAKPLREIADIAQLHDTITALDFAAINPPIAE